MSEYRTASYSFSLGNCVEVGTRPGSVLVRDTKARTVSLAFTPAAWKAFVDSKRPGHSARAS